MVYGESVWPPLLSVWYHFLRTCGARASPSCTVLVARKGVDAKPWIRTQVQGKRIVAFVVGGITHSELRVIHTVSARLGRDITLGGTSVESPATFIHHVQVRHVHPPCRSQGLRLDNLECGCSGHPGVWSSGHVLFERFFSEYCIGLQGSALKDSSLRCRTVFRHF